MIFLGNSYKHAQRPVIEMLFWILSEQAQTGHAVLLYALQRFKEGGIEKERQRALQSTVSRLM